MNIIPWRNKREDRNGGTAQEYPLAHLRSEMDHLFERFWRDPWNAGFGDLSTTVPGMTLRMNVAESESDVTVTTELSGVDPKDVEIDVTDTLLTIRGEKKQEKEEKKRNYHYEERSFGSFHRSIQLPSSVDSSKVDASFKNGVLTVTLHKRPEAKPKRVTVKPG